MVKSQKYYVKNTTFSLLSCAFDLVSPLLCRGCGKKGDVLCECCKNYIISQLTLSSLLILGEFPEAKKVFSRAGFLGFRDEILGELVEEYKYYSVREIGRSLSEIVYKVFSEDDEFLMEEMILVPMPTAYNHIRQRGFDHIDYIVDGIARRSRGRIKKVRLLSRRNDTVQVGSDMETRREQAKKAVRVSSRFLTEDGLLDKKYRGRRIVVFDDVWTTGASLTEAGKILSGAGAKRIEAVAIVKNRQGKSPTIRGRGELFF